MNYELSLLQSLLENKLSLGVNLFYLRGDNMIQVAFVDGKPLNVNAGEVENKGFELSATWQARPNLRFAANYSLLDMTYPILASPEHKLYVSGTYSKGRWGLSSGIQFIGNLYTTLTPEPVKERFVLWNTRVHFKATDWLSLFVRGENLLDQHYDINAGYPMPGATVFGGMRLNL